MRASKTTASLHDGCRKYVIELTNWSTKGPGPYLFGVTWYTIYAGFMSYRLMILPVPTQPEPNPPAA